MLIVVDPSIGIIDEGFMYSLIIIIMITFILSIIAIYWYKKIIDEFLKS